MFCLNFVVVNGASLMVSDRTNRGGHNTKAQRTLGDLEQPIDNRIVNRVSLFLRHKRYKFITWSKNGKEKHFAYSNVIELVLAYVLQEVLLASTADA